MLRMMYRRRHAVALLVILLCVGGVIAGFWTQGYRAYVVHTGSMEPGYMPGDLVVDRPADGHYRPGQIITFRHSYLTDDVVTHRVTGVTPSGLIHTKGDANSTPDTWEIHPDQVRGAVSYRIARGGFVVMFFRQPAGIASLATAVLTICLLWRLFFPDQSTGRSARPRPSRAPSPRHRLVST